MDKLAQLTKPKPKEFSPKFGQEVFMLLRNGRMMKGLYCGKQYDSVTLRMQSGRLEDFDLKWDAAMFATDDEVLDAYKAQRAKEIKSEIDRCEKRIASAQDDKKLLETELAQLNTGNWASILEIKDEN